MKTYLLFSLFLFTIALTNAQSPYKNVLIGSENSPNETSIAFNPFDINNMVVGANIDNYYFTLDGGLTWQERTMTSSYGVWGDPCVLADTKGSFYYIHLCNSGGYYYDRLVCQKSFDGGISWSDGTFLGANPSQLQDKEWGTVDVSFSPYRNNIYVTWTQCGSSGNAAVNSPDDSSVIFLSYSTDDGTTWSDRVRISDIAGNVCSTPGETVLGAAPSVGLNGEVYAVWSSINGIMMDKSTDGGNTWLMNDVKVADLPGGFRFTVPGIYRCYSFPSMACDYSYSAYRGTLYINWTDQRNGENNTDVWISKSTNEGVTWSSPIKVNDDFGENQQFFTWMTVDHSTGIIYVVFYDRRNYNDDRTDVYIASSTDGGDTFINERISESPYYPRSSTFMGDYINIAAANGTIRPVWTRVDSTQTSIWTAIIQK